MAQPHRSQCIKEKKGAQAQASRSTPESQPEASGAPSPAGFMNMLPDTALTIPLPTPVPAAPASVPMPAAVPVAVTPVTAPTTPVTVDLPPPCPAAQVDPRRPTESDHRSAEAMLVSYCKCT